MTEANEIAALDKAWRANPEESFSVLLALGSEHLRTQNLMEARVAFERAEELRPGDAEIQNLLGLTIFKLGEFDRAQKIFEELVDRFPDAIALELNVALVLLKSGKFELARERLQTIVQREPNHPRAGSYLGLVYEQLGDLRAAGEAYVRAGNTEAANKVERLITGDYPVEEPTDADLATDEAGQVRVEVRVEDMPARKASAAEVDAALAAAARALDDETKPSGSVLVNTAEPEPEETTELAELPLQEAVPEVTSAEQTTTDISRLEPLDDKAQVTLLDGMVQLKLEDRALLRSDRWVGRFGDLKVEPVFRRQRGKKTEEHLGGERPVVSVEGRGTALLRFDEEAAVSASFEEEIFVIESRLLALLGACHHETGRLVMPDRTLLHLLRLRGRGSAVIVADRTPARVRIVLGPPLVIQAASLVAFSGKVLPRVASSGPTPADEPAMLNLLGEGEAWIDGGTLNLFELSADPA